MQQYTVTGMHCAACSASVEKAVKKVPGVTSCAVSLLTNSMGVEGTAEPAAVIKAVKDAGYGASVRGQEAADRLCRIFAHSDVFLDGPHDVGLAAARLV